MSGASQTTMRRGTDEDRADFLPILGGRRDRAGSLVVQHGRQPPFRLFHCPTLPRRVVFDLIAFDLADTEIVAFGICEIEARDRGRP